MDNIESIRRSYGLIKLRSDADTVPFQDLKRHEPNQDEVKKYLESYNFASIIRALENKNKEIDPFDGEIEDPMGTKKRSRSAERPTTSKKKRPETPEEIAQSIPADKYSKQFQSNYELVDTIEKLEPWIEEIKKQGVCPIHFISLIQLFSKLLLQHNYLFQKSMRMYYVVYH